MQLSHGLGLHGAGELTCSYCGRKEPLPEDAAARDRHLRLRLMQLERARAASEAPLHTYRALMKGLVPGAIMLAFVFGINLYTQLSRPGAVLVWTSFLPLAIFVGMITGWVGMAVTFRRLIEPMLQARPALHPGMPARCRVCGGELPAVKGTHATCGYCKADNLVAGKLGADVSELLQRESEEYFARARGAERDPNAFSKPSRAFYVWGGAGALVALGLIRVLVGSG
jgi:hypothetical protein